MSEQEQYESVWIEAARAAERVSIEALEYDDEDAAVNLTVATGIIARAILVERKRCADQIASYRKMVEDSEELAVLERVVLFGDDEP